MPVARGLFAMRSNTSSKRKENGRRRWKPMSPGNQLLEISTRQLALGTSDCRVLIADFHKPTGRLLGACSGWRPMGYRFSLLTLLFSGVIAFIKPYSVRKFRVFL